MIENRADLRHAACRVLCLCSVFFVILAVILPALSHGGPAGAKTQTILVLNSYHQGYDWSDREIAGLKEGLKAKGLNGSVIVENMDLKRFPGPLYQEQLKSFLSEKYKKIKIDIIVVFDNPAFDFIRQYRPSFGSSIPIVFAGVNDFTPSMIEGLNNITGIAEIQDHKGTLELALALHPQVRKVLAVHDYTSSGLAVRKEVEALVPTFEKRVTIVFNEPSTYEEMSSRIAQLTGDSLVLILSFATDRAGKSLTPPASTEVLTAHASVPVYATHETRLGYGIVGGVLINGLEHGRRTAAVVNRILAGEAAGSIPVDVRSTSIPEFDYRMIRRFNISQQILPEKSLFIHKPPSFYEQNRVFVWSVATVMAILIGFVVILAGLLVRKKRVQEELERLNVELEQRVADRTSDLQGAMEKAQEADHLKSAFLASMSHELRTPLNSILGFTGIVLERMAGPLTDEQSRQLLMVEESARHLLSLINDVLDISKIEAGQIEISKDRFDMRAAIEAVLQTTMLAARKKGLSLVAAIHPGIGTIESDRRRVEQILLNLVDNAIKFTDHGEVRIDCAVRNGYIETTITDTGIGIKADDMGQLFKPFRQIDSGLARRHEGTGLGLSICKRLVDVLGGRIWVESQWGGGSSFIFTLPS